MSNNPIENVQRSNQQERCQFKWNGFYRALVIDAEDPRILGRVKVRIPDLMPEQGADFTLDWCDNGLWAHPGNNYLGGRNEQDTLGQRCDYDDAWYQGSCLIPPKGSWVFIFFEQGDPNHPYYFAAADVGQRKVLPECQQGAEYWKKWVLFKSRQGRCIVISDDDTHDCRVEITGKKRLITKEPDGDDASIYLIDDNMTTIFLDERPGEEKLLIKDYRGNYVVFHTDDAVAKDQLHIFFQDDIHIETLKNLYIKTGESFQCDIGTNYKLTAGTTIDTKSTLSHKEKALSFDRFAMTTDDRTALLKMQDMAGIKLTHLGGVKMDCLGGCQQNMSSGAVTNIASAGPINISGALTNVQCGALFTIPIKFASLAASATPAVPDGERREEEDPQPAPIPPVPLEDMEQPLDITNVPIITQGYEDTVGASPITPAEKIVTPIVEQGMTITNIAPQGGDGAAAPEPCQHIAGVGHMHALVLKKEYWETIPPLVDKSYGTYTGFYAFKNYSPSTIDYNYIDTSVIPVYDNFENPTDWMIDTDDPWWTNLYDFCKLASRYDITVVPSILDFCCSPTDPYLTQLPHPYQFDNWLNTRQGEYLRNLITVLGESGADYILNLGVRQYATNMPSSGYLRNMILYLVEELGISSNKLALSSSLFDMNPYAQYRTLYDQNPPPAGQINIEEYVDGQLGGTGRVAVYDNDGNLIDGYVKYIQDSDCEGIPCMNTWKMAQFESNFPSGVDRNHVNAMNYVFAPNQREAMRITLGNPEQNNGFIDFS